MTEALAIAVVHYATFYLAAGCVFAVAFLSLGIGRVDPQARGAPLSFKLVVLPGVVVFWPVLAWRWSRGSTVPPEQCSSHVRAARKRR